MSIPQAPNCSTTVHPGPCILAFVAPLSIEKEHAITQRIYDSIHEAGRVTHLTVLPYPDTRFLLRHLLVTDNQSGCVSQLHDLAKQAARRGWPYLIVADECSVLDLDKEEQPISSRNFTFKIEGPSFIVISIEREMLLWTDGRRRFRTLPRFTARRMGPIEAGSFIKRNALPFRTDCVTPFENQGAALLDPEQPLFTPGNTSTSPGTIFKKYMMATFMNATGLSAELVRSIAASIEPTATIQDMTYTLPMMSEIPYNLEEIWDDWENSPEIRPPYLPNKTLNVLPFFTMPETKMRDLELKIEKAIEDFIAWDIDNDPHLQRSINMWMPSRMPRKVAVQPWKLARQPTRREFYRVYRRAATRKFDFNGGKSCHTFFFFIDKPMTLIDEEICVALTDHTGNVVVLRVPLSRIFIVICNITIRRPAPFEEGRYSLRDYLYNCSYDGTYDRVTLPFEVLHDPTRPLPDPTPYPEGKRSDYEIHKPVLVLPPIRRD